MTLPLDLALYQTIGILSDLGGGDPPLPDDLATAAYLFDDPNNIGRDFAGSNDGVAIGAGGVTSAPGQVNLAASFDASTDYIEIADDPAIQGGNRDFTICGWFNTPVLATQVIIAKIDLTPAGLKEWGIALQGGGQIGFLVGDGGTIAQGPLSSNSYSLDTWTFFCAEFNATTGIIAIEFDGVRTEFTPTITPGVTALNAAIGFETGTMTSPFQGLLDQIRFFPLLLSPEQKQALINEPPTPVPPAMSLWDFNDAGDLGRDAIGSNHGTVTGPGVTAFSPGYFGDAADFDPSQDHISIPHDASIAGGNRDFTICGYVYPTALVTQLFMCKASAGAPPASFEYCIGMLNTGPLLWGIGNGVDNNENMPTSNSVILNQWNFFLGEFNSATNIYAVELNGVRAESTLTITPGVDPGLDLLIGNESSFGGFLVMQAGQLDQLRFFDRLLTPAEKLALLNEAALHPAPPPSGISRWTFDGPIGEDSVGANDLTATGPGVTQAPGLIGLSAEFDFSNDHLTIASNPTLRGADRDFSISCFVILTETTLQTIVSKGATQGSQDKEYALFTPGGMFRWHIGNGGPNDQFIDSGAFTLGEWHHLYCEYNLSAGTSAIELDGVRSDRTITLTPGLTAEDFKIGADSTASGRPIDNGCVDQVKFFDRVLSESEKQALRNERPITAFGEHSGAFSLLPIPEAYWRFNHGLAGEDSQGNHDGSVSGAGVTLGPGLIAEAAYFAGPGDAIVIPDDPGIQGAQDFTVVMWVYITQANDRQVLFAKGPTQGGGAKEYFGFVTQTRRVRFGIGLGTGGGTSQRLLSSAPIAFNQWALVLCEFNAATSMSAVEVNGARTERSITLTPGVGPEDLYIGAQNLGSSRGLVNGRLERIRFYHVLLTNAQKMLILSEASP